MHKFLLAAHAPVKLKYLNKSDFYIPRKNRWKFKFHGRLKAEQGHHRYKVIFQDTWQFDRGYQTKLLCRDVKIFIFIFQLILERHMSPLLKKKLDIYEREH
jgi:hypothetical protein